MYSARWIIIVFIHNLQAQEHWSIAPYKSHPKWIKLTTYYELLTFIYILAGVPGVARVNKLSDHHLEKTVTSYTQAFHHIPPVQCPPSPPSPIQTCRNPPSPLPPPFCPPSPAIPPPNAMDRQADRHFCFISRFLWLRSHSFLTSIIAW